MGKGVKKILIAGAGHGGLAAGALLAKAGFDVEVFEKEPSKFLGFDWADAIDVSAFLNIGMPLPSEKEIIKKEKMTIISPSKEFEFVPDFKNGKTDVMMERKTILNYLLNYAKISGVKIYSDSRVTEPYISENKVRGLIVNGNIAEGDLVIDSAGIDSPVRKNLPKDYNIVKDLGKNQIFYAYRAYFDRKKSKIYDFAFEDKNGFRLYLYHNFNKVLSWIIRGVDYTDILIGAFDRIESDMIKELLNDLRNDNSLIGDRLLRGGGVYPIPVRRPLPLFIGDYYAAVGDCACMTNPMTGSGLSNSINAGKIFAETVIKNKDREMTAETLWEYQLDFYKKIGFENAYTDLYKELLLNNEPETIENLFKGNSLKAVSYQDIIRNIFNGLKNFGFLRETVNLLKRISALNEAERNIPQKFSKENIDNWINLYDII